MRLLLFLATALLSGIGVMEAQQLEAQQLNWLEPSLPQAPSPRCCMGLAYDFAIGSTVLFGGCTNPNILGDTWIFQRGWSLQSPVTSPPARCGAGMVWDGAAGNIVLFGGQDITGAPLNDTWTWDGTTWTQQFPPISPPGRQFDMQDMAYGPVTRTVVFFGGMGAGFSTFGDTWTWDGVAKTWTQQFPTASPSPRRASIAFDDVTKSVVLFGGDTNDGKVLFNDTWTWDGKIWRQRFPANAPSARSSPVMAYNQALHAVVLFGGYGPWPKVLTDTWIWNGITWQELNPATVPPNRYSAGMAYDPLGRNLMLFGGYSSGPGRNDTWLLGHRPE